MVATDMNTDSFSAGKEETKSMLTNVRYINKKESVMCFCHLDDDDIQADDRASVPSDESTESEEDRCKSEASSDGEPSKPKKKSIRKSVRFLHENNSDALSVVSEPIKSVHVINDFCSSPVLPPINQTSNVSSKKAEQKAPEPGKWASKRPTAVPDHCFKTLSSLSLSPRITRKMSMETIADIRKAIAESRESIQRGNGKRPLRRPHAKPASPETLQSIPETGCIKTPKSLLPRRLRPVDSQATKTPSYVESDAEIERLDFIKRALSPMPENATTDFFRNRAITISGGENRSWLMKRRNSKETISTEWLETQTESVKKVPVNNSEDEGVTYYDTDLFTTIDLSRL